MIKIDDLIVRDGRIIKYYIESNTLTLFFESLTKEQFKLAFFELLNLKVVGFVGFEVFSQEYRNTETGSEWRLYAEESKESFLKVKFQKLKIDKI